MRHGASDMGLAPELGDRAGVAVPPVAEYLHRVRGRLVVGRPDRPGAIDLGHGPFGFEGAQLPVAHATRGDNAGGGFRAGRYHRRGAEKALPELGKLDCLRVVRNSPGVYLSSAIMGLLTGSVSRTARLSRCGASGLPVPI